MAGVVTLAVIHAARDQQQKAINKVININSNE
jgi:hypothetical protein